MRLLLYSCCFLLCFSCSLLGTKNKKPDFLIGNWIRLNDKEGNQTYERWDANYTGLGYTKNNNKTTFKEQLSIVTINDTLHLKVEGVSENPTLFKFTNQTDTSFTCENQKNEFPKKIKYFLENKQLNATISADDFRIDFIFKKIN